MRGAPLVAVVLAGRVASADVRSFTRTYEYSTVPEGNTTIDLWHTQRSHAFEQVIEIEHGITNSIDIAFLSTFAEPQLVGPGFGLTETKLTGRYRFSERGERPVDTMLHLSAAKDFDVGIYRFEGKLIGSRDFDRLLVAANAVLEAAVGSDVDGADVMFSAAAGATYMLHAKLKLGAEGWGAFEDDVQRISAGPVANWYPTTNFWVTFGAGFGVTEEADDFVARAIIGIELQ